MVNAWSTDHAAHIADTGGALKGFNMDGLFSFFKVLLISDESLSTAQLSVNYFHLAS